MSKTFDSIPILFLFLLLICIGILLFLLLGLIRERRTLGRIQAQISERLADIQAQEQATRERDRIRQRLLGAMSHDMRQPIQAMSLYVQRLERGLASSWVPDSERQAVAQARRGLQYGLRYMAGLLDGVLDVSQIIQGSLAIRAEPVSLSHLLSRLVSEYGPLFQEQRGRLEFSGLSEHLGWVHSDERLLERLLRNLLSNALRYAPGCRVRIRVFRQNARLKVMVSDTGPGIEPGLRQRVRRELQRSPTGEMESSIQGVGLGLIIARQISVRIGARLAMSSLTGRGTAFMVTLPASSPPDLLAALRAASGPDAPSDLDHLLSKETMGARGLVVVISESPQGQHALRVALMSHLREVLTYRDAGHALSELALQGLRPDLLVVDDALGEPNPMAAAEQFESEFNDWIPTLILTDSPQRGQRDPGAGRWLRFLSRPFAPEDLDGLATLAIQSKPLRR